MQFDNFPSFGKDNMDAAMKSFGVLSKGVQAAAVEAADYAKRSFEQGSATVEKLAGARSFDRAVEIQVEYARGAYEGFVSQASKMGELATATVREAFAPVEGIYAKAGANA